METKKSIKWTSFGKFGEKFKGGIIGNNRSVNHNLRLIIFANSQKRAVNLIKSVSFELFFK